MFVDPQSCSAYIEGLRWPDGYICPGCKQRCEPWRQSRSRLVCPQCRHQGSVTVGTTLEKTKMPLLTWFKMAWYLATGSESLPVKELSKRLGIRYRTTWEMQRLLRVAMGYCNRPRLEGTVLAVVNSVRTVETLKRPVLIAIEVTDRKGGGEVRAYSLESRLVEAIVSGVREAIVPGSTVVLEGEHYGESLTIHGYKHLEAFGIEPGCAEDSSHGVAYIKATLLFQRLPRMVRDEHLQSYLDEVVYRFNRRAIRDPGLRFRSLLQEIIRRDCRGMVATGSESS